MKLFKNRGDIYIPKTGRRNTKEARVLFALLAFIVIFTVVFVALLSHKYYSAAEFFGEGEVSISENSENNEIQLPDVFGKTNFLIAETDDSGKVLHYIILLQADKDNKAYKAAALPVGLKIENKTLQDFFDEGGGAALQKKLTEYLGAEIDHYAVFDNSSFVEFTGKLGTVIYSVNGEIHFSGGTENDKYTLRLNEGEEKLGGREITNLLRYYSEEKQDYFSEGELALRAVTGLLNAENFERADSLFRLFIKSVKTDITVRDFENGKDAVYVFCQLSNDITLYTVQAQVDETNTLVPSSAQEIKSYFNK